MRILDRLSFWGQEVNLGGHYLEFLFELLVKMPEVTDDGGSGKKEGIQQYYILKIEELQVNTSDFNHAV